MRRAHPEFIAQVSYWHVGLGWGEGWGSHKQVLRRREQVLRSRDTVMYYLHIVYLAGRTWRGTHEQGRGSDEQGRGIDEAEFEMDLSLSTRTPAPTRAPALPSSSHSLPSAGDTGRRDDEGRGMEEEGALEGNRAQSDDVTMEEVNENRGVVEEEEGTS
ncbi:hypothetical protein H0H92_010863, partial [Tricholoma furcatifolium]